MTPSDPVLSVQTVQGDAHLRALLRAAKPWIERAGDLSGYGYYRPENPHNFHPDPESCTDEEMANHKAACEAWDRGDYKAEPGGGSVHDDEGRLVAHVLIAPWGIGSYNDTIPEAADLIAAIDCALSSPAVSASVQALPGDAVDCETVNTETLVADLNAAALAVAKYKPSGACTCAGPDGPCENCEANREHYEDLLRDLSAAINAVQVDAYAEGRRDEQDELSSVLPGVTYMDPPDGGSPTILEQLQRQSLDAIATSTCWRTVPEALAESSDQPKEKS